jgi:uncharacterized protein (DUF1684 family)
MSQEYLTLLDWRRRVANLYSAVRASLPTDPLAAHALWRKERDALFRSHPQSALPPEKRWRFPGLNYYDYDPRFAFTAEVEPMPEERYDVGTSTGSVIPFVRIGKVTFEIGTLEVWWLDAYSGGVFLPFRDGTAGKTTYGGGRYLLDTAKSADLGSRGTALVLDFNFAYHPSCFYDPKWVCPLAPPFNRIDAPIEAGERM